MCPHIKYLMKNGTTFLSYFRRIFEKKYFIKKAKLVQSNINKLQLANNMNGLKLCILTL